MEKTVYDYARARGVELLPHEVEGWVNSLPEHERQEALLLVLASDTPRTPGHVFPSAAADFLKQMNASNQAPAPASPQPSSAADPSLPPSLTVRGMTLTRDGDGYVKYFEFGTLKIRLGPAVAQLQFASGSAVVAEGESPDAAITNLVGALEDHIADVASAISAVSAQ